MIYIDVSTAVHSRAGLGRYAEKLTAAVAAQRPEKIALFHNQDGTGRLPDALKHLPAKQINAGFKPWRMAVLAGQLAHIGFNRLVPDADLFHSTEHLLLPLRGVPTVLTVHDLIYKLFPAYHKPLNYWYLNLAMPLFCRRAQAIITVSEATKRDVVAHYGIDPGKIHVIHEAAAAHFQPADPDKVVAAREKYGLPASYLVHLGTIEPRNEDFLARIDREGLADFVLMPGWIDDEDLTAVISGARLAVQPSLYEGFGLPLLEHMACGQVVAASGRSSLPEIGGEAAAYFDPENVAEMAAVIKRLLSDPNERQQRREAGIIQAGHFSWERAAAETIELYEQLLEDRRPTAGQP